MPNPVKGIFLYQGGIATLTGTGFASLVKEGAVPRTERGFSAVVGSKELTKTIASPFTGFVKATLNGFETIQLGLGNDTAFFCW